MSTTTCLLLGGPCDGFREIPDLYQEWKVAEWPLKLSMVGFKKKTLNGIKMSLYHRVQPHVFIHESEL